MSLIKTTETIKEVVVIIHTITDREAVMVITGTKDMVRKIIFTKIEMTTQIQHAMCRETSLCQTQGPV
jgi:hypothetical protein